MKSYTTAGHVEVSFGGVLGTALGAETLSVCEEALIKVNILAFLLFPTNLSFLKYQREQSIVSAI